MSSLPCSSFFRFLAGILLFFLLLSRVWGTENPGFPYSFTDAREKLITIPALPESIVSLSPALTEILFAVGAGEAVRGVTSYCDYPEEAREREIIGGFSSSSISIEKIIALEPDLVFADITVHSRVIPALDRLGILVAATKTLSFEDCYDVINLIGRAAGHSQTAGALTGDMRKREAAVAEKIAALPQEQRPRVFWEVYEDPLMTAGPGTFIGQLIEKAGGINIFGESGEDWPVVSMEALILRDPEVLMSINHPGSRFSLKQLKTRPHWQNLTGVKNERVYLFDDNTASRPGPRIILALEKIAAALHPEIFPQ